MRPIFDFNPLQIPLIKTKEDLNECLYSTRNGLDYFDRLLNTLAHHLNYLRNNDIRYSFLPIAHGRWDIGRIYFIALAGHNVITDIYWDFGGHGDYLIKCDYVFSAENKITKLANKNSPAHTYKSEWEKLVYSFAESITVNCELVQPPTTNCVPQNLSLQQKSDLQHAETMHLFDELIKSLKHD